MKFTEALKNYSDGYKTRPLTPASEQNYDAFLAVILKRIEQTRDVNGRLHNINLADVVIEARNEAERKHLNKMFTYGRDEDEPEISAVRHVEMALTDSFEERN